MSALAIPPMTDSLGRYWEQPNPDNVLLDEQNYALVSEKDFDRLKNYSHSTPTGVYVGKMWKRQTDQGKWILCWFDVDDIPDFCLRREAWLLVA